MVAQSLQFGPQETKLMLGLEEKEISVFETQDAKKILGTGSAAVNLVLSGLNKKGRVKRIKRGTYLLVPARAGMDGYWTDYYGAVVPHLAGEYYVAFATAMDFWDMTEQISRVVYVATPKRKKNPAIEFIGVRYEFVTLAQKKFFGIVESPGNLKFNVSSREKTIVDGLMHPQYCGGISEMAKAMWDIRKDADWNAVLEMAERTGVSVVLQRLGYLLDKLEMEGDIAESISSKVEGRPYQLLAPYFSSKTVETSRRYRLKVNLDSEHLLGWMDT